MSRARNVTRKVVLSEDDKETLRILEVFRLNEGNASAAARQLGLDRRTVARHVDRATRRGLGGTAPAPLPDGRHLERMTEEFARDPKTGEWVATRTWAKSRADTDPRHFSEALFAEIARSALEGLPPLPPAGEVPRHDADLSVLIPLADLHLGRKSWGAQTGEAWDLAIAERAFRAALAEVIDRAPPAAEVTLLGLGDLTEADDDTDATPRSGHKQDVDTRHEKTAEAALRLLIWATERLKRKFPLVRVVVLPGNHDERTARMIRIFLRLLHEADPAVAVDDMPSVFWFHRWGDVYLAAHHGHECRKPDQLVGVMATDRPDLWGACPHRYGHMGHLHHVWAKEEWGTVVEGHRSPAARNRYDTGAGHRSGRSLQFIAYHRARGEHARGAVNLPARLEDAADG